MPGLARAPRAGILRDKSWWSAGCALVTSTAPSKRKEAVSEVISAEIFAALGTLYMQQGPQQDLVKGRDYFDRGYKALSVRDDPTLVYSRGQLKAQWGFMGDRGRRRQGPRLRALGRGAQGTPWPAAYGAAERAVHGPNDRCPGAAGSVPTTIV